MRLWDQVPILTSVLTSHPRRQSPRLERMSENTTNNNAAPVILALNVVGDQLGAGLGRAHTMAIATVEAGEITAWEEYEVNWDVLHDTGPEGTHHGRIVRFLREHNVMALATGHMGAPMINTTLKLGVLPLLGASGPAREIAIAGAAAFLKHQSEDGEE